MLEKNAFIKKTYQMAKLETAFVLGAGLGTRLRPLTADTPKPMLKVKGKPLIEHIFEKLTAAGIKNIIINTHHAPQKYLEYFASPYYGGAKITFVNEPELLDTGGGLKNILPLFCRESGILVYNGDIFWEGDISKFIRHFEESKKSASLILRSEGANKNVAIKNGCVSDMRFEIGARYDKLMQFTGIFACKKEFLDIVKNTPQKKFSTVKSLLEMIKLDENSVEAYEDNSNWTDIGTPSEYEKIK